MFRPSTSLATIVALLAMAAPRAQQRLPRATARAMAEVVSRSPQAVGNQLCVKLQEGSGAELIGGVLRSRHGLDLRGTATLFAQAKAAPLFTALSWDELDRWHRRACDNLPPHNRPGHLGLWFLLETRTVEQADLLFDRLWDDPRVDHVVKQGRGTPAGYWAEAAPLLPGDIPPPTPLFTALQATFEAAPNGHEIWRAHTVLGARGRNVQLQMVEVEWAYDHEDLSQVVAANLVGPPAAPQGVETHGTAVASIVTADRNEYGFTGVADEVALSLYPEPSHGGVANTLLLAGSQCQSGDVVMLVMQYLLAQVGVQDWVPFEILQPVFDATLTLTGNGRSVVVTCGNGDANLDDPRFVGLFDPTFRDSGAIMVAASEGVNLAKAQYSNYGSRIDAHSWGEDVCICGAGALFFPNNDVRQAYGNRGRGTSSSTPAIAGLAAALQGAAERQLDRRLTPAEVRQAMHTQGPVSPDPIRRRPNLHAMMAAFGIVDGLELSHPDVALGGSEDVLVTGPAGSGCLVFAGFDTASHDLGFNRKIHLPLGAALTVGFQPMPAGTAIFPIAIPNDVTLRGLNVFVQAGVLPPGNPLHVTNSGQLTVY